MQLDSSRETAQQSMLNGSIGVLVAVRAAHFWLRLLRPPNTVVCIVVAHGRNPRIVRHIFRQLRRDFS